MNQEAVREETPNAPSRWKPKALVEEAFPCLSPLPLFFFLTIIVLGFQNRTLIMETLFESQEVLYSETSFHRVFEEGLTENIEGKFNYIHLNGLFSRMMQNVELNNMIRLKNGYLVAFGADISEEAYEEMLYNMGKISSHLEEKNLPFAFILVPHQLPSDDDEMIPDGYEFFGVANEKADKFMEYLSDTDISSLDLRESIKDSGVDHYSLFPRTDLHWNTEGAFWAHGEIIDFVDEVLETELRVDTYTQVSEYEKIFHPLVWLGSRGQRTGMYFAGLDDISVMLPTFETDLSVEVEANNWNKRGDFRETIYNEDALLPSTPLYSDSGVVYNIYLQGNLVEYYKIINHQVDNDLKVLLLRDSFTLNVAPFLALHWNELHLYDLRYGTQEGFQQVLEEVEPDLVLQMVSVDGLSEKRFFQYFP